MWGSLVSPHRSTSFHPVIPLQSSYRASSDRQGEHCANKPGNGCQLHGQGWTGGICIVLGAFYWVWREGRGMGNTWKRVGEGREVKRFLKLISTQGFYRSTLYWIFTVQIVSDQSEEKKTSRIQNICFKTITIHFNSINTCQSLKCFGGSEEDLQLLIVPLNASIKWTRIRISQSSGSGQESENGNCLIYSFGHFLYVFHEPPTWRCNLRVRLHS